MAYGNGVSNDRFWIIVFSIVGFFVWITYFIYLKYYNKIQKQKASKVPLEEKPQSAQD
jgi:hypothetical protein